MEDSMKPIASLFPIATGFVLFLAVSPSWGAPPVPPDSDARGNIAGNAVCGAVALNLDTDAGFSTAIDNAPSSNNIENCRLAIGGGALLLSKINVFQHWRDDLWLQERIVAADLRDARILQRLKQITERLKEIVERLKKSEER